MSLRPVAIVGAGLVGCGWATIFARAGREVRIIDADTGSLARALPTVERMLADVGADAEIVRVTTTADLALALADAIHVQECVPEDVELKRTVFGDCVAATAPDAIIASSTSALMPSLFTADLEGRDRMLVAHPFNPPHLHSAVEIVPAPWTSAETTTRTADLLESVGMEPIVLTAELDGFVVNRLQSAILHEAFRLVSQGTVGAEDVDRAIRGALAPRWSIMGVFETIDLNAPEGIADYVERYEPLYQRLGLAQKETVDWSAALAGGLLADRERVLPRSRLDERRAWRDRRLIELARFLRELGRSDD